LADMSCSLWTPITSRDAIPLGLRDFALELTVQGIRVILGISSVVLVVLAAIAAPRLWIVVFLLLGALFWLPRKRAKQAAKISGPTPSGFAFPATSQQVEQERQSHEDAMKRLEASMVASGFFKQEKLPELLALLRGGFHPFARIYTKIAFRGDDLLTVEEKRALGLNTRMKYSRKFIEYFDPSAFGKIEPKSALENMHINASLRAARAKDLRVWKELGFINEVKICRTGDGDDCGKIKQLWKVYGIDEVPELPISGCDSSLCRCWYQPVSAKIPLGGSRAHRKGRSGLW
jgi:hypothetical protein